MPLKSSFPSATSLTRRHALIGGAGVAAGLLPNENGEEVETAGVADGAGAAAAAGGAGLDELNAKGDGFFASDSGCPNDPNEGADASGELVFGA